MNKILALENTEGNLVTSHADIASTAVNYFQYRLGQDSTVADVLPHVLMI